MGMSDTAWHVAAQTGWRLGPVSDWSGRPVRYLPAGTVEFLRVPVVPPTAGPDPVVRMAMVPRGTVPTDDDWQDMVWADGAANLLLTSFVLVGEYVLWVDVTAGTERPIREVGLLTIRPGPGGVGPITPPNPGGPGTPGLVSAFIGTYIGTPATGLTPTTP